MIHGIGIDILAVARLEGLRNMYDDPFFQKTYTAKEREIALLHSDPIRCFAERFAAKEAVFKALHVHPDAILLNEIETLNDGTGRPYVNLYGRAKAAMSEAGFTNIFVSLTGDDELVAAFVVCEKL